MPRSSTGAPAGVFRAGRSAGLIQHGLGVFPVDEIVEPGLEVLGASVAVIDVVAVLPDIDAEDWRSAVHQRVFAVGRLLHLELSVFDDEPGPTRAELGDAGLDEIVAHLVVATDFADELVQFAGQLLAAATLLHPLPKVNVI